MKITIIYDNEAVAQGLTADWGFSCLIEMEDKLKILFDTGTDGSILLSNMKSLGVDPNTINEVFISHPHGDHTGGLYDFLRVNNSAKIYVPASLNLSESVKGVVRIKEAIQIHENVFSTGELGSIEQALVARTVKGLVTVVGCSHPNVQKILYMASQFGNVYALIGGLHGFREFEALSDLKIVCPCHCTQFKKEIKSLYPDKCVDC
jgi:7,8-dihydropterin-6-yl-methyl-4-(beta-D-ribofuranosyl)aminobenzene 5'-phosphate synthase